jgi:hypothetical protein
MPVLADRVKETSSTTGTGSLTLAGAVTGFQSFNTAFGLDETFPYAIENGTDWEIGNGYLSGSTTLVRDQVFASSNSNALVSFTGSLSVFCTAHANFLSGANIGRHFATYTRTMM